MHKILVIRIHFPLNALHVSDCISPSSGATCRYMPIRVAIATQQPHVPAQIYQLHCTAYNVAPEDGLIQSETCRASNGK
jgi:hypothetical protein